MELYPKSPITDMSVSERISRRSKSKSFVQSAEEKNRDAPERLAVEQLVILRQGRSGIATDRSAWGKGKGPALRTHEPQESSRTAPLKPKSAAPRIVADRAYGPGGKLNHAFGQKDEPPKSVEVQQEFHPNGRRNHAYKPTQDAAAKSAPAPDAWQQICQLHLKQWVTAGQRAKLSPWPCFYFAASEF
jgi:hypothetical protein